MLGIQINLSADADYSNETFGTVSKFLMENYPMLEKIITTRRGTQSANHNTWVGIMFDGKQVLESSTYQMTHIVDRVGGGNALMAGLIYGFLTYPDNLRKIIDFAVVAHF